MLTALGSALMVVGILFFICAFVVWMEWSDEVRIWIIASIIIISVATFFLALGSQHVVVMELTSL